MKNFLFICITAMCILAFTTGPAFAGWGKCVGCHFGVFAPSKVTLKEKFKTFDEFVKGALASESSMMDKTKNNPDSIKDVAKEIGYTEPHQKKEKTEHEKTEKH